jgi:hypothetical protein
VEKRGVKDPCNSGLGVVNVYSSCPATSALSGVVLGYDTVEAVSNYALPAETYELRIDYSTTTDKEMVNRVEGQ